MRSLLTAFALAAAALPALAARAADDGTLRVALLPMVVHSAEEPRYLREGMADMLESRLERAGGRIRVVRIDDPKLATTRLAEALETARRVDADYVLYGSFTRFGQGASLDLTCAPTRENARDNERQREIFVQSGSIEQVIPALSDLVGKVALFLEADGDEPPVAANGGPPDAEPATADAGEAAAVELELLRRRVEALEAAVYGEGAQPADANP